MDPAGLGVGIGAGLVQAIKASVEMWQLYEKVCASHFTRKVLLEQLENEKVRLAQWSQKLGLTCPMCFNSDGRMEPLMQKGTRLGRMVLSCETCHYTIKRIALGTDKNWITQRVRGTLETIDATFRRAMEVSGAQVSQQGSCSLTGRALIKHSPKSPSPIRQSRFGAFLRIFGGWERSRRAKKPTFAGKLRWAVIEENSLKELISAINHLITQLNEITHELEELNNRQRAKLRLQHWWLYTRSDMKALARSKTQRALVQSLDSQGLERVKSMLAENGHKGRPCVLV